jgi:hypothetical protein
MITTTQELERVYQLAKKYGFKISRGEIARRMRGTIPGIQDQQVLNDRAVYRAIMRRIKRDF